MVVKTMKLDEIIKEVRIDEEEFQGMGTRTFQQLQGTEIKKNQQKRRLLMSKEKIWLTYTLEVRWINSSMEEEMISYDKYS